MKPVQPKCERLVYTPELAAIICLRLAEGERFRATVSTHERTTLDMEAARKKLGAAWCRRHSTTVEQTVVRVSARKRVD